MGTNIHKLRKSWEKIQFSSPFQEGLNDLPASQYNQSASPVELPISALNCPIATRERQQCLTAVQKQQFPHLFDAQQLTDFSLLDGHIENYVGMTQIPTGVIGPLKVKGTAAQGEFFVPLATSEGALLASYHRGSRACSLAGGIQSICLLEGVQRSPLFKFSTVIELGNFITWLLSQEEQFQRIVGKTSRFAELNDIKIHIEGNTLLLTLEYLTGDASGQNMVTICTDAICRYIIENSPIKPMQWYVEGNFSGDKKATAQSFGSVRGKKVIAEVLLPEQIVREQLKTSASAMVDYWQSSTLAVMQSGAIGAQGHYANGLAALFLATGQDVACVAESSIGVTRMELRPQGSLYASVTLPSLMVGTVGGGTQLPTQSECLDLMQCKGQGMARKFAEITAALILAGELSIAAALAAGHFTHAHQKFGRKKS